MAFTDETWVAPSVTVSVSLCPCHSRVILKRNGEYLYKEVRYIYKEVSSEGARPGGVVSLSCE